MEDIGQRTLTIERPDAFFAEDGTMPAVVEMPLELADALVHTYGVKQARERIPGGGRVSRGHSRRLITLDWGSGSGRRTAWGPWTCRKA